jgi:membrane fusion protein (multidrug efflux system)
VPEVAVVTLQPRAIQLHTLLPGRTVSPREAQIRPQVAGVLQRRLFEEGGEVKAGQPLYQVEASSYRAAEARARALVAVAEAQRVAAKALADRYAGLAPSQVISRQDLDNAQAAFQRADAEVAAARAQLEAARIELERTRITSPISGRIGRSQVTEGALVKVAQDQALATVQQLDPMQVDLRQASAELLRLQRDVEAGRVQRLEDGSVPVRLQLEDGSDYPEEGRLRFAEAEVDPATGSVLLRAEFRNPARRLLPGMFVRAVLPQATDPAALLVPQAGISRDRRGQPLALVVDEAGIAQERPVQVGRVVDGQWHVTAGLQPGDRVIVEGLQKARPGQPVKVVAAGAAPSGPPRN